MDELQLQRYLEEEADLIILFTEPTPYLHTFDICFSAPFSASSLAHLSQITVCDEQPQEIVTNSSLLVTAHGIPASWTADEIINALPPSCPLDTTNPIAKRSGQLIALAMANSTAAAKLIQAGFRKYRGALIIFSNFLDTGVDRREAMIAGLTTDVHPLWIYLAVTTSLQVPVTRLAQNPATGTFFLTLLSSELALPTTVNHMGRSAQLRPLPDRKRKRPTRAHPNPPTSSSFTNAPSSPNPFLAPPPTGLTDKLKHLVIRKPG
jgi:hypothetical protein